MRVHELAKELGMSSKEILAKLHELDVDVKSHMSAVDDAAVDLLRESLAGDAGSAEPSAPASSEAAKPVAAAPEKVSAAEPPPEPPAAAAPAAEPAPEEASAPEEEAPAPAAPSAGGTEITIRGPIQVKDLADLLSIRPNVLITDLMSMNILASINERLDVSVAKKIAEKHGFDLQQAKKVVQPPPRKKGLQEKEEEDRPEDLLPRAPVVTVLGHVDHGKTSLLDKIRDTTVAAGEDGGITQHIGASTVDVSGRPITFLDTPGHAAFTAMRARGANLTDIAVIIIAADDGIMPQTREAISHAKAAEVAIIVAINKTDLPQANADRVRQQLQGEDLAPEEWGGQTICCDVSAQTGAGIDHLLEMILLQAEILELRANPRRRAQGFVIEAQLEPGMGPTAHLLVTNGTLKLGDPIVCGTHWGRVKALVSDHGVKLKSAGPSTPVKCLGLSGVPDAGADFRVCSNDKVARAGADAEKAELAVAPPAAERKTSLEALFGQLAEDEALELQVILKTDTQGSLEAISGALREITSDKISLNILLGSTGNITVNDVMLASASSAVVLGFHVAQESGVPAASKREGVEVRLHQVIYELIEEVREAMTGLLAPAIEEHVQGRAQVRKIFPLTKGGNVAGCMVINGIVAANARVRVKRGSDIIYEGAMLTLKHFQDAVAQVREAQECGIRLDNFSAFEEGDILECYELREVEQTL